MHISLCTVLSTVVKEEMVPHGFSLTPVAVSSPPDFTEKAALLGFVESMQSNNLDDNNVFCIMKQEGDVQ